MRTLTMIAAVALCANVTLAAGDPVASSGLRAGLCVMPRADAARALEVASDVKWVVYANCEDAAAAAELREKAIERGLLNTDLYVSTGASSVIPVATRLADLVLLENATTADLEETNLSSWKRMLTPRRGRLVLSGEAVKREHFAGLADVKEQDGWWIATRPAEKGMDEWSHRLHAPDNNLVSRDTYLAAPFLAQWYGLPLHDAYWGSTVVSAQGRVLTIGASGRFGGVTVSCRALGSGIVLWERYYVKQTKDAYQGGYWPGRSCIVAADDVFYYVEGPDVLVLNAETGEETARVEGPKPGGQIQWLALVGDTLLMLAGDADSYLPQTLQTQLKDPTGTVLGGYDVAKKKWSWRVDTAGPVDMRRIVSLRDKVYYFANGHFARCRKVADGAVVWTQDDKEIVKTIEEVREDLSGELYSVRWLLGVDNALVFGNKAQKHMVGLDPQTGRSLWSKEIAARWGRSFRGMVVEDIYYGDGTFSVTSGEDLTERRIPTAGCGPSSATPLFFVAGFGQIQSIAEGVSYWPSDTKSPCDIGAMVADGMMFNPGGRCRCNMETRGYRAVAGQAGVSAHVADDGKRLFAGDATVPADGAPASENDWPSYRAGIRRAGASSAAVAAAPKEAWTWTPAAATPEGIQRPKGQQYSDLGTHGSSPATEFVPTPVSVVGTDGWFADAQGVVRCVDVQGGAEKWRYALGGKAFEPPGYWQGMLYATSADGWVTCLDAATGGVIWRFRAAPQGRLNFWYGHLASTWPIVAGALVDDGVCYVTAGFHGANGVSVWALDARTGEPRWQQHEAGKSAHAFGTMCIADGRLWLASGTLAPVSFSLTDGAIRVSPSNVVNRGMTRGRLVGALAEDLVLEGGRRVVMTHEFWNRNERGILLNAHPTAEVEVPGVVGTTMIDKDGPSVLPAWDEKLFCSVTTQASGILGWETPAIVKGAREKLAFKPEKVDGNSRASFETLGTETVKIDRLSGVVPAGRLWDPNKLEVGSLVLASNAIVAAVMDQGWKLAGYSRTDGTELWRCELTAQPLMDGISIARDGTILVPLVDGSVAAYR